MGWNKPAAHISSPYTRTRVWRICACATHDIASNTWDSFNSQHGGRQGLDVSVASGRPVRARRRGDGKLTSPAMSSPGAWRFQLDAPCREASSSSSSRTSCPWGQDAEQPDWRVPPRSASGDPGSASQARRRQFGANCSAPCLPTPPLIPHFSFCGEAARGGTGQGGVEGREAPAPPRSARLTPACAVHQVLPIKGGSLN